MCRRFFCCIVFCGLQTIGLVKFGLEVYLPKQGDEIMFIVVARAVIVYLSVFVMVRIMGQRQLAEWSLFEFVLALLISDLAVTPMADIGVPLLYGLVPIFVIFVMHEIITVLALKSERLRALFNGKAVVLIQDGKIDEAQLRKIRCSLNELLEQLRQRGVMNINEVAQAVLETSGKLSVFKVAGKSPITADVMQMEVQQMYLPTTIIMDGKVNYGNLGKAGYNYKWLLRQLEKQKLHSAKNVLIATVDDDGVFSAQVKVNA